jgi:uncharacterized membrane protein
MRIEAGEMTEGMQPRRGVNRKFRQQLETEVKAWEQDGTITSEQSRNILSKYVVVSPLYGKLVVIIATLGAILTGVGIILFVSANWQEIPRIGKLVLLIALVLVTYFIGYWLKYERDFPRIGGALIFVGTMVFGAAIFLVGQQYDMPVDDPRLLTWWFLGVIPLAYFTRSKAVLTLAILAALGGLGYKAANWLEDVRYGQYAVFAFYLVLGLALYGIGSVHNWFERLRLYTSRYQIFGLILVFGVLYVLSFKGFYWDRAMDKFDASQLPTQFIVTFSIAAAIAVLSTLYSLFRYIKNKQLSGAYYCDLLAAIALTAVGYLALYLPFSSPTTYAVIFNVVMFALVFGLLFIGYFREVQYLVNLALVFFGLGVIGRYFDLTWELLPRSVFFVVGGLLLLVGGWLLERLRRKTLEKMRAQEVSYENET